MFKENQSKPKDTSTEELAQKVEDMNNKFNRVIALNKQKVESLGKEVEGLKAQLKEANDKIAKMRDKEVVHEAREALHNRRDKPPVDKPIDRNGVAPKDVQLENIFSTR